MVDGQCMQHFAQDKIWTDAETTCVANGGHLATIESQAQNNWVVAISAQTRQHVWIGATDQFSEGTWTNAVGQTALTFTSWRSGEPNGGSGESCASMPHHWAGKWNDAGCGQTYHFVCGLGSGKKRHI